MPAKDALVTPDGRTYRAFRPTLTPRYGRVWGEIGAGWLAILGALGAVVAAGPAWGWILAAPAAVVIGVGVAFLQLWFHEAAHYLVAPTRPLNDQLANLTLGLVVGQDIAAYRVVHFGHHRHLGAVQDPERGYFEPLTVGFLADALFLLRVLRFLTNRGPRVEAAGRTRAQWGMLAAGVSLHAGLLGSLSALGAWPAVAAWLAGMGSVFPLFASIRPLLEHRDLAAAAAVDYRAVPHGEVHRMFGDGPLASVLGGAGFNRHLLHHWEPQLSCTRFAELEAFLLQTPAAPVLDQARSTYLGVFRALFRAP